MNVKLTEFEMQWLAWVGLHRWRNACAHQRNAGLGPSKFNQSPDLHIRGASAEFAVAVGLNLSWRPTVGDIKSRDVGSMIEVRSTDRQDGRLIVKPADSADAPFVLVIEEQNAASYRIAGWMLGRDAQQYPILKYGCDPAHYVPQSDLRPIDELRGLAHRRASA